ncbi:beta-ketoacyl-[acyl-carrier-protein] synthase family protein [Phycicoccus flavus]|uniref:beta-ketoacyl-[acyl-carrier-protein] synthase family protein n=1 Tax=Phycicoccus flavus TaxID=2502783 RepID=UPI000FEBD510|nr:beta-ketoacyl-ACP synthase II [Phycicoccus flavus]NHA66998.1 beta-ketoacyl-ACP synthase II [Phycicoccus flavus]
MRTHHEPARVVVTGIGAVAPNGLDAESAWAATSSGRSGIATLTDVELDGLTVTIGGEVTGFDPSAHLSRPDQRRLSRYAQLGVAAAREAMSAHVTDEGAPPFRSDRFSVLAASGYGPTEVTHLGTRSLGAKGPRGVSANGAVYGAHDSLSSYLSVEWHAQGPSHAVAAACASGTVGVGEGMRMVRHGYADAVLVVTAEHSLNVQDIAATANIRALATDSNDAPERGSRPFDRSRSGFVMSAGAAALLLESEASARDRGARVLAEVRGYGCSSDAHHATAPHPEGVGAQLAMRQALADAGCTPADVGYVNAHGTSTPYNDATELAAIAAVFGEHAHRVPISSTKSTTGHLIGAAGALEAIFCIQAMRDRMLPPTINLDDPEFPEFDLVPHVARTAAPELCMSNSFGFGGHNATVVLAGVAS